MAPIVIREIITGIRIGLKPLGNTIPLGKNGIRRKLIMKNNRSINISTISKIRKCSRGKSTFFFLFLY